MEVGTRHPFPTVTTPLLGQSLAELEAWALEEGQAPFRGRQIHEWIYRRGAREMAAISVLPQAWRTSLQEHERREGQSLIGRLAEHHRSVSADGTTKLLLGTSDDLRLETVGIPTEERLTVCVSSQVGCPMACRFCATGLDGLARSLALHEIVDQVLSVREAMDRRPTHVVFMGMGEPLLNTEVVLQAIGVFCRDLGMAQRQITLSTVGVPGSLPTLAERALEVLGRAQFTLAVSLHAPDQALREQLIPTARAYPLAELLQDCRDYALQTSRRVSFEYILLAGVNDAPRQAVALAHLLRGFQSHVNLIPYNPIAGEIFARPSPERVERFRQTLVDHRIAVSVRASRGLDQDAACGQLRRSLAAA